MSLLNLDVSLKCCWWRLNWNRVVPFSKVVQTEIPFATSLIQVIGTATQRHGIYASIMVQSHTKFRKIQLRCLYSVFWPARRRGRKRAPLYGTLYANATTVPEGVQCMPAALWWWIIWRWLNLRSTGIGHCRLPTSILRKIIIWVCAFDTSSRDLAFELVLRFRIKKKQG